MQQQLFQPEQAQIPPLSETINAMRSFIFDKWDSRERTKFELIRYIPFFVYEHYEKQGEIEPIADDELSQLYERFLNWLVVMGTKNMNAIQRAKFKLVVTKESFLKSYAVLLKWEEEYFEIKEWSRGIL